MRKIELGYVRPSCFGMMMSNSSGKKANPLAYYSSLSRRMSCISRMILMHA
jgi:hypothetical protein